MRNEKAASLDGLGIDDSGREELERLIQDRLNQNYLYNLEYVAKYDLVKFNVMLEARPHPDRPFKALASLRYLPAEGLLSVITVY